MSGEPILSFSNSVYLGMALQLWEKAVSALWGRSRLGDRILDTVAMAV
jgi:hypothetical protein